MSKIEEMRIRLMSIELLSLMRERYGYGKLSELLSLPIPVMSRYINGKVLPSFTRSQRIVSLFTQTYLVDVLKEKIVNQDGFYDMTQVNSDIMLQKVIGKVAFKEFSYIGNINKILTVATNGIPIAVQVANEFNARLIIAKKSLDWPGDYVCQRLNKTPSLIEYLYIPKKSIKKGEKVLIVDDLIRTGATVSCLNSLIEKAKARTAGVFAIVAVKGTIERLKNEVGFDCKVRSIIDLA